LPFLAGCVGAHGLAPRDTVALGPVRWFTPSAQGDRVALGRWRSSVGEPLVSDPAATAVVAGNELTVISWNIAVGDGDIERFVTGLRRDAPLVLLLQEAYRAGPGVPRLLSPDAIYAGHLGAVRPGRSDIQKVAERLGLRVYYVPSMRNGAPTLSDEDRGNAILSNLPLSDLSAIELPFERQRRVAIAATVTGQSSYGATWHLRVVSAHLDNMIGVRRMLASGGEFARARQARGLVDLLDGSAPLVLGGDFNTWFGFSDRGYLDTARSFPQTVVTDRRPTFRGLLRLDHLFFRFPAGWRAEFHRGDDRFGSDHFPLVGTVHIGASDTPSVVMRGGV
jgi:endonuclease/exonuclease/phosphatase family metal-dependent hydrolase